MSLEDHREPDECAEASTAPAPAQIELVGDTAITDEEWRRTQLNGATHRTGTRYDQKGCPRLYVNGIKMRPVNACKQWLTEQIVRGSPKRGRGRR
jgi:hypothetical protein